MARTISEQCADFIAELQYDKLPDSVRTMAKNCLIDFLGCTLGGSGTPEGSIILEFAQENKELGKATVIGDWSQNSLMNTTLANAYNCHILECDDVHQVSITHAGAPVVAAALALAESEKKSGKQLIEAIVAGYEILLRAGEAVMPSHYYFWHTTATCGAFGSAAAAGKLLDLSRQELVHAIGNAGTQASGLWEFLEDNAMSKYLHCGRAASSGVLAAILAKKGFTGPSRILEGERGLVKATSQETNPEHKFSAMGTNYKILENSFKPYASCRHTHSTIDAILKLKEKYQLEDKDVEGMTIHTYKVATQIAKNNEVYDDARAAKFSLVYCAAAAMHYGDVTPWVFSDEALKNPNVISIAQKVNILIDEEYSKKYPQYWMAKVSVQTVDGRSFDEIVEFPKGDPDNPLTEYELEKKFLGLALHSIRKEDAEFLLKKCRSIEDMNDVSGLFQWFQNYA